ncbi:MAG: hypothetical protein HYY44_02735, partial [Deltaproteobacteria bacterium]|nr:hypothetical protein [Deltaproteobacteria bacterium]
ADGTVVPAFTVKKEGLGRKGDPDGETYFIPYFNAGSIPLEPSRDGLTPPDHPFGGVPIKGDVPALLAFRMGLRNIPVGEHLPVNIEFGKGIAGGTGLEVFGNRVSSTGWSFLASGRVNQFISEIGLRWGIQKTVKDAAEEPELNQF